MPARKTAKPSAPAARRLSSKGAHAPVTDLAGLAARVPVAAKSVKGAEVTRAAAVVQAGMQAAQAQEQGLKAAVSDLTTGAAAFRAGAIDHAAHGQRPDSPLTRAACRSGCAFCCILQGKDGGVVTAHEAQALHTALAPLAGQPDGRAWHRDACPALDPETRMCRAYDARPVICRSYFSEDAAACEGHVKGVPGAGSAVLGAYPLYLAVIGLARALLGVPKAPTYALNRIAAAAVEGKPLQEALKAAKHTPSVLTGELARTDLPRKS